MRRSQPTLAGSDHGPANEMETYENRPNGRVLPSTGRGRPSSIPAERAPTRASRRAPEASRVLLKRQTVTSTFQSRLVAQIQPQRPRRCPTVERHSRELVALRDILEQLQQEAVERNA